MKICVIDNYDSFTYNLVYILRQEYSDIDVFRNDKIEPSQCLFYNAIILSPGPGVPSEAGNLASIVSTCAGKVPIFGVCLGHQAIAEYLGGSLRMLNTVHHGVQSTITIVDSAAEIFKNIAKTFHAGRYHSWDVTAEENNTIEVTAVADDNSIMAIQNEELRLYGIQFHPESILTPDGATIIQNFLGICTNLKQ